MVQQQHAMCTVPWVMAYIDMPNVVGYQKDHWPFVHVHTLNPYALKGVLSEYNGQECFLKRCVLALSKPSRPKGSYYQGKRRLEKSNITVIENIKDVDPLIIQEINDIDFSNPSLSKKVIVTLVSGDSDYVLVLKRAKQRAASHGINLEINIISWSYLLSKALREIADNVIDLEDVLYFLDYPGYTRLQQVKEQEKQNVAG